MDDLKGVLGLIVLLMMIFLTFWGIHSSILMASHEYLGSKGGPCFANMTCREGLRCVKFDGIKPTCVK